MDREEWLRRLPELSWRQLGFQLDEAIRGSNPNLYDFFTLLCEAKRRCDEDIKRLKSTDPMLSDSPNENPPPPLVERVADMTHRGAGF